MANLQEKLNKVYGATKNEIFPESSSWIPKRMSNDPVENYRRTALASEAPTPVQIQSKIEEERMMFLANTRITETIELFLLAEYGEKGFDQRRKNYRESFDRLFEKHGTFLIMAMYELLDHTTFVNHAGYIIKKIVKDRIRMIEKRD